LSYEKKKKNILYTSSFFLNTTHTVTSPFYLFWGRKAKFLLKEVGKNKEKREDNYNVGNKRD